MKITDHREILDKIEREGAHGLVVCLFGPGPVIFPIEEEIVKAVSVSKSGHVSVDVVDCEGLDQNDVYKRLNCRPLFGGLHVVILRDVLRLQINKKKKKIDLSTWEKAVLKKTSPFLIIESESPPTTGPLKDFIERCALVIDQSLKGGPRKEQLKKAKALILEWLEPFGKVMRPDAMDLFLRSVSLDDASFLRTELEKVASASGDRKEITQEDVSAVTVSSKKEDAYLLTDALGKRERESSYTILENLLSSGMHELQVLQLLATWLKRILALKCIVDVDDTSWHGDFSLFKQHILPAMTKRTGAGDVLPGLLKLHPYALYNLSLTAEGFTTNELVRALAKLHHIDLALKGGGTSPRLLLEMFIEECFLR